MSLDPTLEVSPASPASGDGVMFTARGVIPEGATIVATGADEGGLVVSPAFGIGEVPEGTGDEAWKLEITGGTSGTFVLGVYEWGDGANLVETDPIYYYNDAPTYAYPDSDDLIEAIEDALPGSSVSIDRTLPGAEVLILIGGNLGGTPASGKRVVLTVASASIDGSETITLTDEERTGGPFVFGPVHMADDDWTADIVDDEGESIIEGPIEFTVG